MKGANTTPQNRTVDVILINTEVNIYLNSKSWTKVPLKRRQQSKLSCLALTGLTAIFPHSTFQHFHFTNSLVIVYVSRRDINLPIKARGLSFLTDVTTVEDLTADEWCTPNQRLFQLRNTFSEPFIYAIVVPCYF